MRTDLVVWFWAYYILIDRVVSLGYLNSWLYPHGYVTKTFQSIIDIIWGLPEIPSLSAVGDVITVATLAWFLTVAGPTISRNYMFLLWWAGLFWFGSDILFKAYIKLIKLSGNIYIGHEETWYVHPGVVIFGTTYITFKATQFVRYLLPALFLQKGVS